MDNPNIISAEFAVFRVRVILDGITSWLRIHLVVSKVFIALMRGTLFPPMPKMEHKPQFIETIPNKTIAYPFLDCVIWVPFMSVQAALLTKDWMAKTVNTTMGKLTNTAGKTLVGLWGGF